MKVEFWKTLPEELLIPELRTYPQNICNRVDDVLTIRCKEVSIQSWNKHYSIVSWNDEDKTFTASTQKNWLFLSQHEELNLFLILIKFAQEQWIIKEILSVNWENFLSIIQQRANENSMRSPLHQWLYAMDCMDHNLAQNTLPEFSVFNIWKWHHCNKETYKVSTQWGNLLFSFNSEIFFTIHVSEIIVYLRLLIHAWEGIASQCLYILEYIFNPD